MAPLSAMQHRIAFVLLITSLAFAAMTLFMLCLMQPKQHETHASNGKPLNVGMDAYAALAGLPIRRRGMADEGIDRDAVTERVPGSQHAQRHGGSVLPLRDQPFSVHVGETINELAEFSAPFDGDEQQPIEQEADQQLWPAMDGGYSAERTRSPEMVDVEQSLLNAQKAGLLPGSLLDVTYPYRLRPTRAHGRSRRHPRPSDIREEPVLP